MLRLNLFLGILLIMIFESCNDRGLNFQPEKLVVKNSISEFSDSLILSRVKGLLVYDDKLVFAETNLSKVFYLSKDLSLVKTIGTKGEGPDDISNICGIKVKDSLLYILDGGNATLKVFDCSGKLINRDVFKDDAFYINPDYRFEINGMSSIVISSTDKRGAFADYNLKNGTSNFWGKRNHFDSKIQERLRNGRNVFSDSNYFVSVSDNLPEIEMYDKNHKIKEVYNYSQIQVVKNRLNLISQQKNQQENSYSLLCQDAYLSNNNIYILLMTNAKNDEFEANTILEFSLIPEIQFKKMYKLPGKIYSSIAVGHDLIYSFNHTESRVECYNFYE